MKSGYNFSLSFMPALCTHCSSSSISLLWDCAIKTQQPKGMPRANIQILHTILQDHTAKMCFPSLPIEPFIKLVARIIPVVIFLGVYSSHVEEVSWRSQPHAVLEIFVFLEASVAGITSSDSGEEEGEEEICSYTLFPHNSTSLSAAEVSSLCHGHTRSE